MSTYRRLPSIERLVSALPSDISLPHAVCVAQARLLVAQWRNTPAETPAHFADMVASLIRELRRLTQPSLRRVINATGVLLQTNLGRAPLSAAAQQAIHDVSGTTNVEYDLATGTRSDRHLHVQHLICQLTQAESAVVVNNNAAAILLTLMTLAAGREVIVSRGQAVEIGGGFRIPDVLRQSGATLVEVGTTNRTYVADYAEAITPQTALILRVHHSNFRIHGFTYEPDIHELATLAHQHRIMLVDNVGSGSLIDVTPFGLAYEPCIDASIAAGADVVCFSGDKLIGGPQAGLIVGQHDAIRRIARHPLMRALRPDKLTLAALAATLQSYVNETAYRDIPIWRMISTPLAELEARANALIGALPAGWQLHASHSTIGGGALPGETLPSWALVYAHDAPDRIMAALRQYEVPVIGRIHDHKVWLDVRTIAPGDDATVIAAIHACVKP